ncbi:hypothetical protein MTO96_011454 [Rhipicephalus appendiculatus]
MDHVLVQWVAEEKWDVYPLKNVVDAAIGYDLVEDTAAALERLKDTAVEVLCQPGEPTAPATILAVEDFFIFASSPLMLLLHVYSVPTVYNVRRDH